MRAATAAFPRAPKVSTMKGTNLPDGGEIELVDLYQLVLRGGTAARPLGGSGGGRVPQWVGECNIYGVLNPAEVEAEVRARVGRGRAACGVGVASDWR